MASYTGLGLAWRNGGMVATATTFWTEEPKTSSELDEMLFDWAIERWPPSKGWSKHLAHVTMEISKPILAELLEHARDDVEEFGDRSG